MIDLLPTNKFKTPENKYCSNRVDVDPKFMKPETPLSIERIYKCINY